MKKLLFILVFISSCITQKGIKGEYQNKPFIIYSDKSIDELWSNIIDLFAQNGLPIGMMDKPDGFITSGKISMISRYSFENKNGQLIHPTAWIVLGKIANPNMELKPSEVTADWNIRIKDLGKNRSINVNLVNIEASLISNKGQVMRFGNCASTGIFEQDISKFIAAH